MAQLETIKQTFDAEQKAKIVLFTIYLMNHLIKLIVIENMYFKIYYSI